MPVSNFKFVSPGVFIEEIDNSFLPREAENIGPVVIGRAKRGLGMQPVTVQSYSEFVEMFGDTVPGNGAGDVYRDGNYQSPMYATYAAKAFLNSNVAPLTFVRLLGQETTTGGAASEDAAGAGWKTIGKPATATPGGAYGLFVYNSSSAGNYNASGDGTLAAVIYVQSGSVMLSGSLAGTTTEIVKKSSTLVNSDSNGNFKIVVSGSTNGEKVFTVSLNEDDDTFIRKTGLNKDPQKTSTANTFFPTEDFEDYWLGETYEQELNDAGFNSATNLVGAIVGIALGSDSATGMHDKKAPSQEAIAGWFIGQDLGDAGSYSASNATKLFRLIGRGHGEWLHKHAKVSIDNIRQSTTTTNPYGTFSLIIRDINDNDQGVVVLERFDNLTLDPTSENYIARRIGDKFLRWNESDRILREYGDYDNRSKFVRVEMDPGLEFGNASEATLLPFGYYGPPQFSNVAATGMTGSNSSTYSQKFITLGTGLPGAHSNVALLLSSSFGAAATASFTFPEVRLRPSGRSSGVVSQKKAYFGFDTTRTSGSSRPSSGIFDAHNLLLEGQANPNGVPDSAPTGVDAQSYIFTMDDISGSAILYQYNAGSRAAGTSFTAVNGYEALLNNKINKFTAPFWGGFDGFDITKPDPLRNGEMSNTSTEDNSYVFHTYNRAIETIADPEQLNMNLLAIPGLTNTTLTTKMIDTCAERADAMAIIDLPDVYVPPHERYYSDRVSRTTQTDPTTSANNLKNRRIDSSYGATFYPWVQTVDRNTGQNVWVPPTVAMMGVFGSSEAASEIWFAPAGFNRGGLSDGAAGIPIVNVSQRLTSGDRDTLYEARINPIASFPSEGIVVFGQKTLQERRSALDRINVRRLVIFLKKQISIESSRVLFEQNVQATWNNFRARIRPILANAKARFGITEFKLILDNSTTTPDLIDQNILYAKIMVKPARAIEFIAIDFVIASSGASFND